MREGALIIAKSKEEPSSGAASGYLVVTLLLWPISDLPRYLRIRSARSTKPTNRTASVEALRLHQNREPIQLKVMLEVASKQTEPAILCLIGKLLALLGTRKFQLSDVLKVMNHLVNQHR